MIKKYLDEFYEGFKKNISADIVNRMAESTEKLAKSNLLEKSLKVGDVMPRFNLKNATGDMISSDELLKNGSLVISFYRGSWCPYCNIELRGYQSILNDIKSKGAQLVAISPEVPDESLSLSEKLKLEFEVLSDENNLIAKEFGIAFELDDNLKDIYNHFGVDLEGTQGNANYEMPVPATFVVNQEGIIVLAYVDVDYTNRLEPTEVLEKL